MTLSLGSVRPRSIFFSAAPLFAPFSPLSASTPAIAASSLSFTASCLASGAASANVSESSPTEAPVLFEVTDSTAITFVSSEAGLSKALSAATPAFFMSSKPVPVATAPLAIPSRPASISFSPKPKDIRSLPALA